MANAAENRLSSGWLTVDEVAKRFELGRHAIYRRIRAGHWDGFVSKFGRTIVDPEGLEAMPEADCAREGFPELVARAAPPDPRNGGR